MGRILPAMKLITPLVIALSFTFVGCAKDAPAEGVKDKSSLAATKGDTKVELKTLSVEQLSQGLKNKNCTPVDVNGKDTRAKVGMVPGAVQLASASDVSALPKDKDGSLVFYCYNTNCGASDRAAEKASEAGYKNVAVMKAGIKGWVKAGQTVEKLKEKS